MPILFLKATGAPRKYANMPGYVKIKGHWVRANKDIKAPAGAPKAAHPEAHAKGKPFHMPEEHAKQLMYPEDKAAKNHEMKNFNAKHVPNLLAHAKEGDVTAILGHKYGTNTHAKKLVAIANHLLEQMGSSHKVSLGQQAGAHEAISKHPKEKGEQTPAEAPKASEEAAQAPETPSPKEEAKEAVAGVADALQEPVEKPAEAKKTTSKLEMPAFMSGKQSKGVRTAYEVHAQKILDAVAAKDINALQALVNPAAGAWKGKTSNSQMLLAFYGQALAKLQQGGQRFTPVADEPGPVAAVETLAGTTAQPKPTAKVDASAVTSMDWDSFKTPDNIKSSKGYNKQLDAVKGAAEAGDVYGILALKYGTNTYAKKVAAAANMALTKLGHPGLKVVMGKEAVHPLLSQMPQPSEAAKAEQSMSAKVEKMRDAGPKEGDTRMGKNGMQVLKDGHWVNQETDKPEAGGDKPVKFKEGQQVTPEQVKDLPAGTIIQTYDHEGKPNQKFLLGHACAWYITSAGKQHKNPIAKGNYQSLVGIAPSNTDKYANGYHSIKNLSTLEKVGKDWVSAPMKAALKAMHPGAKAMGVSNVYAIHGGEYMLITNPGMKVKGGIIITEQGEWYGAQALGDGYKDPTFAAVMAGKTPDAPDLAAKLGLVPDVTANLPEPPEHDKPSVNGNTKNIALLLAEGDYTLANDYIGDCAEILKDLNDGTEASLNVMNWLVHAKAKAHEGIQSQPKPDIEPVPAPAVEPAKMTPLPKFKNVQEFQDWKQSDEGEKWLDEGELFYGGSGPWDASPEAQEWDEWQAKLIAEEQAQAEKEQAEKKAKKAALENGPKEGDTRMGENGLQKLINGHWVNVEQEAKAGEKPAKPDFAGSVTFKDGADVVEAAMDNGDLGPIETQIEATTGLTGEKAQALNKYATDAKAWMESQGKSASPAAKKGPQPVAPEGLEEDWSFLLEDIDEAVKENNVDALDDLITSTVDMQTSTGKAAHQYAKTVKAWMTGDVAPFNKENAHAEIASQGTMVQKVGKAKDIAKEAGTEEAWQGVIDFFNGKGLFTISLNVGAEAVTYMGPPEGYPAAPTSLEQGYQHKINELLAAIKYLPRAQAEEYVPSWTKAAESLPGAQGKEAYLVMTAIYKKLMGKDYVATGAKKDEAPAAKEKSAFDQILDDITLPGEEGPKEGDTRMGKNGMQILKDGHWVNMGVDDVPLPKFVGQHASKFATAVQTMQEAFQEHGKDALKNGPVKFIWHKGGTVTIKAPNVTVSKANPHSVDKDFSALAKYAFALKNAVSKEKKPKAKKKVGVAKNAFGIGIPAVDNWEQTGPQKGSNPGGKFKDADGNEWYVKFPADEEQAKSEVLAARLYNAAGAVGQQARLITRNGKIGIASRWVEGVKKASPDQLKKTEGVLENFALDAWLGNWDVVGTGYDNLQIGPDGRAVRVDAGGSLMYRAQGQKKEFGNEVTEIDTLRDAKHNSYAAAVFGDMTDADIAASVARITRISKAKIYQIVEANAPGDAAARKALAETLIARQADLRNRYPQAAKTTTTKATFHVENLTPPPDFTKWEQNGGKPLSSVPSINEANNVAVNEVYTAAKEGDLETINNVTASIFDKGTHEKVGDIPLAQHPSQHVKTYWENLVNEVDLQLNPPEAHDIGQVVASDDMGEIMDMIGTTEAGEAVKSTPKFLKIGNYIVKGKIADVTPFVPEANNTVTNSQEWKDKAKAIYAKASKAAKSTFALYVTSSGAAWLNTALRKGDLDAVYSDKTVRQHMIDFNELLVDVPEGATFVRNMGNSGYGSTPDSKAIKELEQFLIDAEPGTIIQEPGFSSTSYVGGGHGGILGSNNIRWEFTAAKGVKMFPAWLTANKGEGEGLLPPNAQYSIVSSKKVGKTVVVKAILLPTKE